MKKRALLNFKLRKLSNKKKALKNKLPNGSKNLNKTQVNLSQIKINNQ
jgi:hypothetical protein